MITGYLISLTDAWPEKHCWEDKSKMLIEYDSEMRYNPENREWESGATASVHGVAFPWGMRLGFCTDSLPTLLIS